MTNINYDLCNDSSLISQLKLLVNQFLICHLICTHKSHVKSCFDSMRFFPVWASSASFHIGVWGGALEALQLYLFKVMKPL